MTIKDKIKVECIKQNKTLTYLAKEVGLSKSLLHHHLIKENKVIISKIEKILGLKKDFFYPANDEK